MARTNKSAWGNNYELRITNYGNQVPKVLKVPKMPKVLLKNYELRITFLLLLFL